MGCHSKRRQETLSGRKFLVIQGEFRFRTADWLIHHYADNTSFVPRTSVSGLCNGQEDMKCRKLSISHRRFRPGRTASVEYPVMQAPRNDQSRRTRAGFADLEAHSGL